MARILVVEDDENNFELLRWDLDDLHHECKLATNAFDAVELARNEEFDLVLMDITIPPRDGEPHNSEPHGLAASMDIRRMEPRMPIVAITAHGMAQIQQSVLDSGCNAILEKPFDFEQLEDCLQEWLDHKSSDTTEQTQ